MIAPNRVTCAVLVALAAAVSAAAADPEEKPANAAAATESITVEIKGKLNTGVFAIGGETTGTTITASGLTFELDFGEQSKLSRQAEGLDGQTVIVKGTLEGKPGVEIPLRYIVTVTSLKAAEKAE